MRGDRALILEKLRHAVRGSVQDDRKALQKFSHDESIYEIRPLAVGFPEDADDVQRLIEFARNEGIAITPRGGGSGTAGSALGHGIVIALPDNEFWGRINGFSEQASSARVTAGAGVYHNDLQIYLRHHGFFLPADVTSAAISKIGGNLATKASGPHALRYGSIDRFVESVEFITDRGEFVNTADDKTIPERITSGLADLERRIRTDDAARKLLETRKIVKTSSGYNLFGFLDEAAFGLKIAQLMTGSVGTLGVITGAVLRAEAFQAERAVVLLYFDGLAEAGSAASLLRESEAAAIELISRETIRTVRAHRAMPGEAAVDAHLLIAEVTGPERKNQVKSILSLIQHEGYRMSAPPAVALSKDEIEKIWTLRKQLLWLVRHPGPGFHALAVVNDVGVPPERLAPFISDVQKVFLRHGIEALVYGHAGSGNLHLRPLFDVTLPDIRGRIRQLADDVYEIVFRHSGTITAEHGMGRLRAPYLKREWGEALHGYMREIKTIFDPDDRLNPGVMFGDEPITENLRPDLLAP